MFSFCSFNHHQTNTRSEFRFDDGGLIEERTRFSFVAATGAGGITFFGIFFRPLIETGPAVLFDEFVFGDASSFVGKLVGDLLLLLDVVSGLSETLTFALFVRVVLFFFVGDVNVSFFFATTLTDVFTSDSVFNFVDERIFVTES